MIELNDPSVLRYMDDDERQEFYCLILEGFSEKEAARRAHPENDRINGERLRGPRAHDRQGHGAAPLVTDYLYTDMWEHVTPVTQDTRSDVERQEDWERYDRVHNDLLTLCTERQRTILTDLYGLDTGTPMTYPEVADKHGMSLAAVTSARTKGLARIRRLIENPPMTEEERSTHQRLRRRDKKRRERARKKNLTPFGVTVPAIL